MSPLSYADVFNLFGEAGTPQDIRSGDVVRTGSNHYPHYEVLAVSGNKAWVRNVQTGEDHLAPLDRCRKVPVENAAPAKAA